MKWDKIAFSELVEFPPKVPLEKGELYDNIPMDVVDGGIKYVQEINQRIYTGGGAKFSNGDTLFARITPCLENGKIAKVKGLEKEHGFGSTEFFVFRAIHEVSDSDFIYYLAKTDLIRQPAIKSMVGASGRQRADKGVVERIPVPNIPLPTQRRIASILSAYDDLIENNMMRIKLLEEAARCEYRLIIASEKVFIEYTIDEVCQTVGGGTPSTGNRQFWDDGNITWFSPTDLTKHNSLVLIDSEKKITQLGLDKSSAKLVPPKTILMTSRATIGYFGMINKTVCTNQGFICIIPFKEHHRAYMLYNLIDRKDEIISHANGSTYLEITKGNFRQMKMKFPTNEQVLVQLEESFEIKFN
jgi:type I restriction enzyme, S subunit